MAIICINTSAFIIFLIRDPWSLEFRRKSKMPFPRCPQEFYMLAFAQTAHKYRKVAKQMACRGCQHNEPRLIDHDVCQTVIEEEAIGLYFDRLYTTY
jgi:hypothetical protein